MDTAPGSTFKPEIDVRLFAAARLIAGSVVVVRAADVSEVRARLSAQFGDCMARVLLVSGVWVNGEPASDSHRLATNDEVAVIPPVSGGCR